MEEFNEQLKTLTISLRDEVDKLPYVYRIAMPKKAKDVLEHISRKEKLNEEIDYFQLFIEACDESRSLGAVNLAAYESYLKPYPKLYQGAKLYLELIEDFNNGSS